MVLGGQSTNPKLTGGHRPSEQRSGLQEKGSVTLPPQTQTFSPARVESPGTVPPQAGRVAWALGEGCLSKCLTHIYSEDMPHSRAFFEKSELGGGGGGVSVTLGVLNSPTLLFQVPFLVPPSGLLVTSTCLFHLQRALLFFHFLKGTGDSSSCPRLLT